MIEKQIGRQVKCLRTDNGLEFCSDDLKLFAKNRELLDIVQLVILHNRME